MTLQMIVIGIAGSILVIYICIIIYLSIQGKNKAIWPPVVSDCPDFFTDKGGNGSQCVNTNHLGKGDVDIVDFTKPPFISFDKTCQKKKWAASHNLSWDGITNLTRDPCITT